MPHIIWLIDTLLICAVVFLLLWALVSAALFQLLGSELWRTRPWK